jgi:hypothetical protein
VYLALGRLGTEAEARPWAGPLCWAALGVLLSLLLVSSAWLVVSDLSKYVHCKENPIYVYLFWELHGLSPNFHIHVSVSHFYIPRIGPME